MTYYFKLSDLYSDLFKINLKTIWNLSTWLHSNHNKQSTTFWWKLFFRILHFQDPQHPIHASDLKSGFVSSTKTSPTALWWTWLRMGWAAFSLFSDVGGKHKKSTQQYYCLRGACNVLDTILGTWKITLIFIRTLRSWLYYFNFVEVQRGCKFHSTSLLGSLYYFS